MNNSDQLKHFVNPSQGWPGQLLDVETDGHHYAFELVHTTVYQPSRHQKQSYEHVHEVYHLVLCTHGDNAASINGKLVPMKPGYLIAISPGEPHSFGAMKPGYHGYHEVTFQVVDGSQFLTVPMAEYLSLLSGLGGIKIPRPLALDPRMAETLERRFVRILDALQSGSNNLDGSLEILGLLMDVAQLVAPVQDFESTPERRLALVKRHLNKHFASNDTVEDLADLACMSRGHFLREFKRAFGVTPVQYRLKLRMEAAKSLLVTSNLPCKEISERLGFGDEFHFSRTFKRLVGSPPSRFREAPSK